MAWRSEPTLAMCTRPDSRMAEPNSPAKPADVTMARSCSPALPPSRLTDIASSIQVRLTSSSSPSGVRPTGTLTANGRSVLDATCSIAPRNPLRRNSSEVLTMLGQLTVPSPPAADTAAARYVVGEGPIPSCMIAYSTPTRSENRRHIWLTISSLGAPGSRWSRESPAALVAADGHGLGMRHRVAHIGGLVRYLLAHPRRRPQIGVDQPILGVVVKTGRIQR